MEFDNWFSLHLRFALVQKAGRREKERERGRVEANLSEDRVAMWLMHATARATAKFTISVIFYIRLSETDEQNVIRSCVRMLP